MEEYIKPIDIRWSDLDPNLHLRHSAYYDFGAYSRISFMEENGLNNALMQELQFGPILFREEAIFRKEIRLGDKVSIHLQLLKARKNFSRWTIRHQLMKNDHVLAATITVEGAWSNLAERKLACPPADVVSVFDQMPRATEFEWHGL